MNLERGKSESQMLRMHAQGRNRALQGRPIIMEAVRKIKNPERVKEYLAGYVSGVELVLEEIGVFSPEQIGVGESLMHVIVQNPNVSIAGIEGLTDGMRGVEKTTNHSFLGKYFLNHYEDGFKIGNAFLQANLRKGNFEALAHSKEIAPTRRGLIYEEIRNWLENHGFRKTNPDVVAYLHPLARLAFAFFVNNGEEGFENYKKSLEEKVEKDTSLTIYRRQEVLFGIEQGFRLAKNMKINR